MAAEFAVSYSPLSHNIYAGRIETKGVYADKTTVTNQAVGAVAEFLADTEEKFAEMTHKRTGERYRVTVEVLPKEADDDDE